METGRKKGLVFIEQLEHSLALDSIDDMQQQKRLTFVHFVPFLDELGTCVSRSTVNIFMTP
jgi:hypothetical protein